MDDVFPPIGDSGAVDFRFGEDFFPNASSGESAWAPERLIIDDEPNSASYYDAPLNLQRQPYTPGRRTETTQPANPSITSPSPFAQRLPYLLDQLLWDLEADVRLMIRWNWSRERCEITPQELLAGSTLATCYAGKRFYRGDIQTLHFSMLDTLTFVLHSHTSGANYPSYNWQYARNVDQAAEVIAEGATAWADDLPAASYYPNSSVTYNVGWSQSSSAFEEEPPDSEQQLWAEYLNRITGPDSDALTEEQRMVVRELWEHLREVIGESLPVPQAGPVPGAVFGFVWEQDDQYVEIELVSESKFDWFYTDKSTGDYKGRDGCSVTDLPPELIKHLTRLGR